MKIYEVVGKQDSELAGEVFAQCTTEYRAKLALEKTLAAWEIEDPAESELGIRQSNLALDTIEIDDQVIALSSKYWDIHFVVHGDCKPGYSVFVEATNEQEALDIVRDEHLYEEPEDLSNIDYIDEITQKEYLEAKGLV